MAPTPLLPKPGDLAKLTDRQTEFVVAMIDKANRRELVYAQMVAAFGFVSFLGCVVAFCYLVVEGHPKAAGIVLGTGALGIVGKFIAARLQK